MNFDYLVLVWPQYQKPGTIMLYGITLCLHSNNPRFRRKFLLNKGRLSRMLGVTAKLTKLFTSTICFSERDECRGPSLDSRHLTKARIFHSLVQYVGTLLVLSAVHSDQ